MDKLKNVPILGYLIRLFAAVVKLPKHVKQIYALQGQLLTQNQRISQLTNELNETRALNEKLKKGLDELGTWNFDRVNEIQSLQTSSEELKKWNSDRMSEIQSLQTSSEELKKWNSDRMSEIQSLQKSNQELKMWNSDRMHEIQSIQAIEVSDQYIEKMNYLLSIHKTLWGDAKRLHISELASVDSCFFNTNSGDITVGKYTFSGSGVSLLAGNHDKKLTGLLRRDAELKNGCDIIIGNGVWLASDSTILGPVTIGDNAIVAAGAVVVPGTIIPPNTIYAGIPAKQISKLKLDENMLQERSSAFVEAMKRENHVLFVDGWTEKRYEWQADKLLCGHFMIEQQADIYTTRTELALIILDNKGKKNIEISCEVDDKEWQNLVTNNDGEVAILLQNDTHDEVRKVRLKNDNNNKLFISLKA